MNLAEKLQQLRTDRDLSQGDLADKIEVTRQSISKWETGQSVPDLDKIIKLADLFGVTVDDLVREEGQPRPEASTPQVIYVEKRRESSPRQSLQVLGILCEAVGAALVVLGLLGMDLLLLLGVGLVLLGFPPLLMLKHPFLIDGWLLYAISWLFMNPWMMGAPVWSLIAALRYAAVSHRLEVYLLFPLLRDLFLLVLLLSTWRTARKKKLSREADA